MRSPSHALLQLLQDPVFAERLTGDDWNPVIRAGRTERLLGTLSMRLADVPVPQRGRDILEEAADEARRNHDRIRFEIERVAEALLPTGMPVVLLKGGAYLAADLAPLPGRQIGDLDILVPEDQLREAEAALHEGGWRSVKPRGEYDDEYYRKWMHELPPLAHEHRGNVVDLHHNILPRTARLTPNAESMLAHAEKLPSGFFVLSPEDMLLHAAVHLAYDGDFEGGARNLWDIDRMVRSWTGTNGDFLAAVENRAVDQGLLDPLRRALRLSQAVYATPLPSCSAGELDMVDRLALRKLHGRGEYGELKRPVSEFVLFARGHWLRMPPLMLAGHLATKWRVRRREAREQGRRSGR